MEDPFGYEYEALLDAVLNIVRWLSTYFDEQSNLIALVDKDVCDVRLAELVAALTAKASTLRNLALHVVRAAIDARDMAHEVT